MHSGKQETKKYQLYVHQHEKLHFGTFVFIKLSKNAASKLDLQTLLYM